MNPENYLLLVDPVDMGYIASEFLLLVDQEVNMPLLLASTFQYPVRHITEHVFVALQQNEPVKPHAPVLQSSGMDLWKFPLV